MLELIKMAEQLALDLQSVTPPRKDLIELWTPDDIYNYFLKEEGNAVDLFTEDNRVEWKSARYEIKNLQDYYSMWSNTHPAGGIIVIGVENDGTINGFSNVGKDRISELEDSGRIYCPDARYETKRISVINSKGENDYLLIIRVFYREDKLIETVGGEAFYRSGKNKRRLTEDEKREFRINKGEIAYEKEDVSLQYPTDFNENLIDEFCKQYRLKRNLSSKHTSEQILCLNHLGRMVNANFKPNLACALLFAHDPRSIIPGIRIRFMRFEGTEEKTGKDYNVIKETFVDGPLPLMLREAEQLISSQIRNFTRLGTDGKFYTRPEYPNDVWFEAVVNACVHRSYNFKNMNIFVKMLDDRIIIESPGGFPPPVTPQNIYDNHNPRNPHLMNALYYLDYVKCAHEGTRRMRDMMKDANLPAPEFSQKDVGGHQVHVLLRNNVTARKEFVDAGAIRLLGEGIYEQLSQEEKQVLNYIAEQKTINVTDTIRLLHKDWETAKKVLESLRKKEILTRVANPKLERDPKAHYILRIKNIANDSKK